MAQFTQALFPAKIIYFIYLYFLSRQFLGETNDTPATQNDDLNSFRVC